MKMLQLSDALSADLVSDSLHIKKENPELESALNRYRRELHHCNLILERIWEENEIYQKAMKYIQNLGSVKNNSKPNWDLHWKNHSLLVLDIENYFIHTAILMEKITKIIGFLLPDLPNDAKSNFHQHRQFFLKNDYSDMKYSVYIKKRMEWYSVLLQVFRNVLIIHDESTSMSWLGSDSNKIPHIAKTTHPDEKISKETLTKLYKIRDNHNKDIPELANEVNLWELLGNLTYHADKLTSQENKILRDLIERIGSKFPAIEELTKRIQEFLDFIGNHFVEFKK